MTRLSQNHLHLKPDAENVLPRLDRLVATTEEGDPLVSIGGMVFDPRIKAVSERQPGSTSDAGFQAWYAEYEAVMDTAAWISFTLAPAAALELAKSILARVGTDGEVREPRAIRVLNAPK